VVATGPDRRITYWNRAAEKLYGWTADEVLGRDVIEVTTLDRIPGEKVLQPVERGESWAGEFMVRNREGGAFPAFVTISPLADDEGRPAGVLGLSFALSSDQRDERAYQAQAELSERNLQYDALFETMSEGFALCKGSFDVDGHLADYTILEINPALQRMLGVGAEATGTRLRDGPGDHTRWLALCEQVFVTGRPSAFEYHHIASGKWHEVRISRVSADQMAQFFFDITERKEAVNRQAQLFDELNHRVMNNLTLVSGILQMKAQATDSPVVRDQLFKAVARVQSIALVHRALYRGARKDDVDFGGYLHDLCSNISNSVVHDADVTVTVDAEPANIAIDTVIPLGMVVNELVTNAVKYAHGPGERGAIHVRFGREKSDLVLIVSDDGRGLPSEEKSKTGGLGMTMVRSLVVQVGGALTVNRGPGAAFTIRLPDPATPRLAPITGNPTGR